MTYTNKVPIDDGGTPIASGYSKENNTFPALVMEPGAYQDSNNNQSSAVVTSFLRPLVVQKAHAVTGSGAKTLTCAFANNNIAGNSIVVGVGLGEVENGSTITLAVTDANGNSYAEAVKASQSTTLEAAIFYATNIIAGANTITITIAGGSSTNTAIGVQIYEAWGLIGLAGALDQTATGSNAGSTSPATAAITPVVPNELCIAVIAAAGGTITAGTNWSLDSTSLSPTGGNLVSFGVESRSHTTIASLTPSATLSGSNAWAMAAASFKSVTLPVEGTVTALQGTSPWVVSGSLSATNPSVGTDGSAIPTSSTLIGASDGTDLQALQVDASKNLKVNIAASSYTEQASLSAGSLNADLLSATDVSAYKWVSITVLGTWSGTLTVSACNDNSSFDQISFYQANGTVQTSITSNHLYFIPVGFRYLRIRMTSYSSGTANGVAEFYTTTPASFPSTAMNTYSTGGTIQLSAGSALIGGVEIYDSAGSNKLAVNGNGAATVQDLVRYMTTQDKVYTVSTGSQAGALQTSGVCIFNAAANNKNILVFSIRLINTNAGQNTLQELRKVTANQSYSNALTPVNNDLGSSTASVLASSGCTWQVSATPTGTPLDQSNTNTNSVQDLLTNHRTYLLPSGVDAGLAMFVAQGGTGGFWAVTFSYIEY